MKKGSGKEVYQRLKTVMDPELQVNIVDLGLIYKVGVTGGDGLVKRKINIKMTLTSPGCPLAPVIDQMVRKSLTDLVDDVYEDVGIEVVFDPPWTPEMMSEEVRAELGFD